jgi:hypothetical protein
MSMNKSCVKPKKSATLLASALVNNWSNLVKNIFLNVFFLDSQWLVNIADERYGGCILARSITNLRSFSYVSKISLKFRWMLLFQGLPLLSIYPNCCSKWLSWSNNNIPNWMFYHGRRVVEPFCQWNAMHWKSGLFGSLSSFQCLFSKKSGIMNFAQVILLFRTEFWNRRVTVNPNTMGVFIAPTLIGNPQLGWFHNLSKIHHHHNRHH